MIPNLLTGFSFHLLSLDVAVTVASLFALLGVLYRNHRRTKTTPLNGPQARNWMLGVTQRFLLDDDPPSVHIEWEKKYGPAYLAPIGFGRTAVILCDAKACAHFLARETFMYRSTTERKAILDSFLGKGILWAEGEDHRRQRRALTPAFSNAALRKLTLGFYDSVHKVKSYWDNILLQSGTHEAVIEVQDWMNRMALDSLGHAAFSHHFGSLDNQPSEIYDVFEAFASSEMGPWSKFVIVLAQLFSWAFFIPSHGTYSRMRFAQASKRIAGNLLEREHGLSGSAEEMDASDKSVLGLLLKSERALSESHRTSPEEIEAQIRTLVLAGYETTSTTITWTLIELCRNPDVQAKLRQELLDGFPNTDPTWDDLWYKLPYLDAVVLETLRKHPVVPEIPRYATEDNVVPLSRPATTRSGEQVSSLFIAKGTRVTASIGCLTRSQELWGPDAEKYIPERWLNLEDSELRAKEIQGHKHLMVFSDGPRICLGKNFALAEIKSALAVLLKNYAFEFKDENTSIASHFGLLKRPKVKGYVRAEVPLKIRKVEVL